MLTSMLLEASGAGSFFSGSGNYFDEYPYLDLTEATALFPASIIDSTITAVNDTSHMAERRASAIVESSMYGTELDFEALVEAGFESVKSTITKIFDNIRKFINSIIAKIKVYISSYTKSGRQLAEAYESDIRKKAANGAYTDLQINCYDYISNLGTAFQNGLYSQFTTKINDVIALADSNIISPEEFKKLASASDFTLDSNEAAKAAKTALADVDANKLKKAVIENMSGVSVTGDAGDWKKSLGKALRSGKTEKTTVKYGTAPFTLDVIGRCKNPQEWENVKKDYDILKRACDEHENALKKITIDDKSAGADALNAYVESFVKKVSLVWNAVSIMKDCKVSAMKEMNARDRAMIGMLVRKDKKKEKANSDVEFDEFFDFDFA